MADKKLRESLESKHPEYLATISDLQLWEAAFDGGSRMLPFLRRYKRESDQNFRDRKAAAYYINVAKPGIVLIVSYITGQPVRRSAAFADSDKFKAFLGDATLDKTDYASFMAECLQRAASDGIAYVIVDRPQAPNGSLPSQAAEAAAGLRTYVRRIPRSQVIDWEEDASGDLVWIKILEPGLESRESWDSEACQVTRYRIWTRTEWVVYRAETGSDAEPIVEGRGPNTLGRVPVVRLRWPGGSLLTDAAPILRAVFCNCSGLEEIVGKVTFPQLVIGDDGKVDEKEIGLAVAFTVDKDAMKPFYLQPDSTSADVLEKRIANGIEAAKNAILQRAESATAQAQSGVAKAYDFSQLNETLKQAALAGAQADFNILTLWAAWEKASPPVSVEYAKNFDIQDLARRLDDAIKAGMTVKSRAFSEYLQMAIVSSMVDPREAETIARIKEEIQKAQPGLPPAGNETRGA